MRLHFDIEISDKHVDALEVIKAMLMTDSAATGITQDATLEQIYCECSMVGLATLAQQMMTDGSYAKHLDEIELGKDADKILRDIEP